MRPIHHLVLFALLSHATLSAARVAVTLYAVSLDSAAVVVGVLIGLFGAPAVLASVPMGKMVDRRPARLPMLACIVLSAVGSLLPFMWEGLAPLFITSLFVGGAYFTLYIINSNLAGRYGGPEHRAGNFALMHMGLSVANGIGPLIAGFGIDHLGHAHTFLVIAVLPLLALALVLLGKLPLLDEVPARREDAKAVGSFVELLRDPAIQPVYVITVLFTLVWDTFMVLAPIYGAALDLSASRIGIIISTFAFASFAVRVFTTPLTRLFSNWQLLLLSLGVAAACCLGFGMSSNFAVLLLLAFGIGFGQGLGGPIGNAALFDVAPPHRSGEALGVRTAIMMSCQTVLPLLAGAASSLVGVAPLFWCSGIASFAGAWFYRGLWRSRPPLKPKAP